VQHPLESTAGLARWAARNMAYNLEFIPEDKLTWKPAPTANSALEVVSHIVAVLRVGEKLAQTGIWEMPQFQPLESREAAKEQLESSAEAYAAALTQIDPAILGQVVKVGPGFEMPMARAATLGAVDALHHHGQIAYIQTLLGDTEMHFMPMSQ
jgi:uncharacterized damage-inducible protein DinB